MWKMSYVSKCDNCPHDDECLSKDVAMCEISQDETLVNIWTAVRLVYRNERSLFNNTANEKSIIFNIWYYLKSQCELKYHDMSIDIGYGDDLNIIIHRRDCNKHNYAYLIFRLYTESDEVPKDYNRLCEITDTGDYKSSYRYRYGASICLYYNRFEITWFRNGKILGETIDYPV